GSGSTESATLTKERSHGPAAKTLRTAKQGTEPARHAPASRWKRSRTAMRLLPLSLFCGLGALLLHPLAAAQPVTGSGFEVAWLTPETGAVLDVEAGREHTVAMRWPRRLSEHTFLASMLQGSEVAWIHLDGEQPEKRVQFVFISGTTSGTASIDATPEPRG